MDPLSALSLACNILDLIERGWKCATTIKDIYESEDGLRKEHAVLLDETETLSAVANELHTAHRQINQSLSVDPRMRDVAAKCLSVCTAIETIIKKCKPKNENSKMSATSAFIRTLLHKSDIEALQTQLQSSQTMLNSLMATKTLTDVAKMRKEISDTSRRLEGQMRHSRQQKSLILAKLDTLDDSLDSVKAEILADDTASSKILEQLKEVLTGAVEASEAVKIAQILESLHFPTMKERFCTVNEAHPHTFEWIFDKPETLFAKQADLEISFSDWLKSGSGIFHIEGKPGSGKSTLMKYLYDHNTTAELLREWAGDRTLIFSQFFFWRLGTAQERSLNGLIRGLLSDIIQREPQFAKLLFPKQWPPSALPRLNQVQIIDLTDKEITVALNLLVDNQEVLEKYCICFFIDGLDEFDESQGQNYYNLTEKLRQWASSSHGNVKLCVSSRQFPVFLNAFASSQRLTVHIFTEGDISQLVEQRLEKNILFQKLEETESRGCNHLIVKILSNADGVFLWVIVLLNQLEDALISGDSMQMLHTIVDTAPTELDDFFRHILDSVPSRYRRNLFFILAIVMRLHGALLTDKKRDLEYQYYDKPLREECLTWRLSLLSYSYLLEGLERGPLKELTKHAPVSLPNNMETYQSRIQRASAALTAQCRGLLESRNEVIKFTHRSIPEFLQRFLIEEFPNQEVDDADISFVLAWMALIEVRYVAVANTGKRWDEWPISTHDVSLLEYDGFESVRHDSDSECDSSDSDPSEVGSDTSSSEESRASSTSVIEGSTYSLWAGKRGLRDRIVHLIICIGQMPLKNPEPILVLLQQIEQVFLDARFGGRSLADLLEAEHYFGLIYQSDHKTYDTSSMLVYATVLGLHEFLIWDHQKKPAWYLVNILLSLIIALGVQKEGYGESPWVPKSYIKTFEHFLQTGISVATEIVSWLPREVDAHTLGWTSEDEVSEGNDWRGEMSEGNDCEGEMSEDNGRKDETSKDTSGKDEKVTLWNFFLASTLFADLPGTETAKIRPTLWLKPAPDFMWKIFEPWLRHGANPHVTFSQGERTWFLDDETNSSDYESDQSSSMLSDFEVSDIPIGVEDGEISINMKDKDGNIIISAEGLKADSESTLSSFRKLLDSSGGSITLEQLLQFHNPPNLPALLLLIEHNKKVIAEAALNDHDGSKEEELPPTASSDDDTIHGQHITLTRDETPYTSNTFPPTSQVARLKGLSTVWMLLTFILSLLLAHLLYKTKVWS